MKYLFKNIWLAVIGGASMALFAEVAQAQPKGWQIAHLVVRMTRTTGTPP